MSTYSVAKVPGDGTGPEVVREAVKVLAVAGQVHGFELEYDDLDLGGERYLRTEETLTGTDLQRLGDADAILFGAVGQPDVTPGVLEQDILLRMRRELDQFINLRPIKLHPGVKGPLRDVEPADVDMVVVRENREGLYVNQGEFTAKGSPFEVAVQQSVNSRFAVERCIRYAFDLAVTRPRAHLTMCAKTNVLTYASGLWARVFEEVGAEYPNV